LTSSSDYNVFAHLTAEKSDIYRAVLNVFVEAKARFVIYLRPRDVERQLVEESAKYADALAVEVILQQLVAWGNLEAHPDTAEVLTVHDFWRVRNLYQMSPAGEAAEAALYRLLQERLKGATIISIGHRSTLGAFHGRRIALMAADEFHQAREVTLVPAAE